MDRSYEMVHVGKDCDYLTHGKAYAVSETELSGGAIVIQSVRDDSGFIYILTETDADDFITIEEWRERKLGELGID
jgi:hypothetical protein